MIEHFSATALAEFQLVDTLSLWKVVFLGVFFFFAFALFNF